MDATQVRQLVSAGHFLVLCECGEIFKLGKLALEESIRQRLGYCVILRRRTHLEIYR
jgi:hypothetical protein